jgi:hypothetical protein
MIAGVIGLVLQSLSTSLAEAFGDEEPAGARLLDASFSLDGTIGAFAITSNLALIMNGLGLGALFIRSLTLMLSREKVLDQLVFLEHGAHNAIGALGLVMLAGVLLGQRGLEVPEWLTGLIGIVLLAISFWDSLRHRRRFGAAGPAD